MYGELVDAVSSQIDRALADLAGLTEGNAKITVTITITRTEDGDSYVVSAKSVGPSRSVMVTKSPDPREEQFSLPGVGA